MTVFSDGFVARINLRIKQIERIKSQQEFIPFTLWAHERLLGLRYIQDKHVGRFEGDVITTGEEQNISQKHQTHLLQATLLAGPTGKRRQQWRMKSTGGTEGTDDGTDPQGGYGRERGNRKEKTVSRRWVKEQLPDCGDQQTAETNDLFLWWGK